MKRLFRVFQAVESDRGACDTQYSNSARYLVPVSQSQNSSCSLFKNLLVLHYHLRSPMDLAASPGFNRQQGHLSNMKHGFQRSLFVLREVHIINEIPSR